MAYAGEGECAGAAGGYRAEPGGYLCGGREGVGDVGAFLRVALRPDSGGQAGVSGGGGQPGVLPGGVFQGPYAGAVPRLFSPCAEREASEPVSAGEQAAGEPYGVERNPAVPDFPSGTEPGRITGGGVGQEVAAACELGGADYRIPERVGDGRQGRTCGAGGGVRE